MMPRNSVTAPTRFRSLSPVVPACVLTGGVTAIGTGEPSSRATLFCSSATCAASSFTWSASVRSASSSGNCFGELFCDSVSSCNVVVQNSAELGYDVITAQCCREFSIDVNGRNGLLERAGQRNADIGVLG